MLFRAGLRSSLILLPILGLTWIFGIMSFNSDTIVFQYLFGICNSLQVISFIIISHSPKSSTSFWKFKSTSEKNLCFSDSASEVKTYIFSALRKRGCFAVPIRITKKIPFNQEDRESNLVLMKLAIINILNMFRDFWFQYFTAWPIKR